MVTTPSSKNTRGREPRIGRARQALQARETRLITQDIEREAALTRLLTLLETEAQRNPARAGRLRADSLSRIARLQAARASYALATTGEMERVGMGAWIRRRPSLRASSIQ